MIERLPLGERRKVWDSGRGSARGLCLVVGKRTRSWALQVTADGRQVFRTLGRWPALSVEEARAKGLPTGRILFRHALRPSSFSLMTLVGLQMAALIGGTVVVEQIFALPGVGRLMFASIGQRDLLVVQGVTLLVATSYVLVNFVIDVLYTLLDPRIRHGARA